MDPSRARILGHPPLPVWSWSPGLEVVVEALRWALDCVARNVWYGNCRCEQSLTNRWTRGRVNAVRLTEIFWGFELVAWKVWHGSWREGVSKN